MYNAAQRNLRNAMEDLWAVDHFEEASNTLEEIGQYSKALRLF